MGALWVVPCRFDPDRPVIFECIEAIQRHHDNPKILVVDSASPDRSYFDWLTERDVRVAAINNTGYGTGAHAWGYRQNPDADYFYMMFDSLIVQSNCDEFQDRPVTVVRHWHNSQHDWGWDEGVPEWPHLSIWGGEQLDRMGVPRTDNYHGIMGPMMFLQGSVAKKLDEIGYWDTQVTSRFLQCGMERVAGITLEHLGHDVTQSLQGTHTVHTAAYDETYVKKLDLTRP